MRNPFGGLIGKKKKAAPMPNQNKKRATTKAKRASKASMQRQSALAQRLQPVQAASTTVAIDVSDVAKRPSALGSALLEVVSKKPDINMTSRAVAARKLSPIKVVMTTSEHMDMPMALKPAKSDVNEIESEVAAVDGIEHDTAKQDAPKTSGAQANQSEPELKSDEPDLTAGAELKNGPATITAPVDHKTQGDTERQRDTVKRFKQSRKNKKPQRRVSIIRQWEDYRRTLESTHQDREHINAFKAWATSRGIPLRESEGDRRSVFAQPVTQEFWASFKAGVKHYKEKADARIADLEETIRKLELEPLQLKEGDDHDVVITNLVFAVRRMSHEIAKSDPNHHLACDGMRYLVNAGLLGR